MAEALRLRRAEAGDVAELARVYAGIAGFEAWVTPFSRPVFERAGFAVVEVRTEIYRGLPFERTRVRRG